MPGTMGRIFGSALLGELTFGNPPFSRPLPLCLPLGGRAGFPLIVRKSGLSRWSSRRPGIGLLSEYVLQADGMAVIRIPIAALGRIPTSSAKSPSSSRRPVGGRK